MPAASSRHFDRERRDEQMMEEPMHGSFAGMGDRAGRAVRKFRISSRKRIMAGLAKEIAEGKSTFCSNEPISQETS